MLVQHHSPRIHHVAATYPSTAEPRKYLPQSRKTSVIVPIRRLAVLTGMVMGSGSRFPRSCGDAINKLGRRQAQAVGDRGPQGSPLQTRDLGNVIFLHAELPPQERVGQRPHESALRIVGRAGVSALDVLVIRHLMPPGDELRHHLAGVPGMDAVVPAWTW